MKIRIFICVCISFLPSFLSAQTGLQNLVGDWEVKSFFEKGKEMGHAETSFRISLSDAGDYLIQQVLTKKNTEVCTCTGMLVDNGDNLLDISLVMCSDEEKEALCKFWLIGTYTWTLKNGTLVLTGKEQKMELLRK